MSLKIILFSKFLIPFRFMIRFNFTLARNSPLAKIIRISVNFRRTKSIPDNRVSPCAVKGKRDKQAAQLPLQPALRLALNARSKQASLSLSLSGCTPVKLNCCCNTYISGRGLPWRHVPSYVRIQKSIVAGCTPHTYLSLVIPRSRHSHPLHLDFPFQKKEEEQISILHRLFSTCYSSVLQNLHPPIRLHFF